MLNRKPATHRGGGHFYGWWIVAVGFTNQFCAAGFGVYAFSVLIKPMVDDSSLDWSRTDLVWGMTFGLIVSMTTGPLFGAQLDRKHGARILGILSGLAGGIGMVLISRVEHLWQYYLLFGIVTPLFHHTTIFLLVPTIVSKWFIRRRGRALIISTMGRPLSGIIMLPLVQVMISTVGWRSAWLIMGISAAAIVVPINALVLRRRPEDIGLGPDGDPAPGGAGPAESGAGYAEETAWTLALAMRTPAFWLVLIANNLAGAGTIGVLVNQVAYLKENFSDGVAVTGATLITAMSLIGRFMWLMVADRLQPRYSASTTFLLSGLGMLSLIYATSVPVLILWVIFFGLGISGMEPLTSVVWASYFGRNFLGSIRGFVTLANAASIAGSPLLAAAIADFTGDYRIAFLIFLIGFVMATLLMYFARPPTAPRAERLMPIEARG